jgi:hypothetical protein
MVGGTRVPEVSIPYDVTDGQELRNLEHCCWQCGFLCIITAFKQDGVCATTELKYITTVSTSLGPTSEQPRNIDYGKVPKEAFSLHPFADNDHTT